MRRRKNGNGAKNRNRNREQKQKRRENRAKVAEERRGKACVLNRQSTDKAKGAGASCFRKKRLSWERVCLFLPTSVSLVDVCTVADICAISRAYLAGSLD
eukprot:5860618-Pleurochrysis_carterae.AAC.1